MAKQNQFVPQIVYHPGETLVEKLDELQMGPKEFSIRTNKPEKTITAIIKGESSITPDMAVQFENVLKIPAHFWLNSQRSYDEFVAREKHKEVISQSIEWANLFPLNDMIKKSWLPQCNSIEEKTTALLKFFGISNYKAWENYYLNQELKIAFRISLAHESQPHAISAWLRKGELSANELGTINYSEKKFKESLISFKEIMSLHPADFFQKLQALCLQSGVKLVHTPCLPKAPINGATRWINDTPLIQLSGRYHRNDIFWFTFFHEAGHIILHGKKDIFLEKVDNTDKNSDKEKAADDFAVNWTLSMDEETAILKKFQFNENDIIQFAKEFNTHPAIIVGRLQYKGKLPHSFGNKFIVPIELN